MKYVFLILYFCIAFVSKSQYYIRGEVKDAKGNPLSGVLINVYSKGEIPFYSESDGAFGVTAHRLIDTIYLTLQGYQPFKKAVNTQQYQVVTLQLLPAVAKQSKNRLSSIIKNAPKHEEYVNLSVQGESYRSFQENDWVYAKTYPEIGFSLNIDRAAYSNIRRFLNNQIKVPIEAVRIEEMLNYFNLRVNSPVDSSLSNQFTCASVLTNCPWNPSKELLFLNINAPKIPLDSIKPSNFVFLIDVSGSMDKDNRLPLLQQSFKLLTENLREIDKVSIVTYGGGVHLVLPPTSGANKEQINKVIDSLSADGDTPGEGAIRTAYNIARSAFLPKGNNRVILATDGDFNVGQTTEKELEDLISAQRSSGIYLTCLGVGMGNYKDSKLETLAKKGDGNFAYIDNIQEAEKVLVTELTKTMYNVATDAFVNVVFNPELVKNYRLIGFDNKKDAIADPYSELEGGEVGSGHNMMAIFEIEKNNAAPTSSNPTDALATIHLKYTSVKTKENMGKIFLAYNLVNQFQQSEPNIKLAAAIALFGSLLRLSKFAKGQSFAQLLQIAESAISPTSRVHQELITLIKKAEKLYKYK